MDTTTVITTNTFSQINELIGHIIWPIFILLFLYLFRKKISELILSLKKIKFSDFEAEFNEREKNLAEQDISPLNDEVDGLNKKIEDIEETIKTLTSHKKEKEDDTQKPDDKAIKDRIYDALENGPYRWRSVPKLSSVSGISEEKVLEILGAHTNTFVLSMGKSGRKIARLKNK